MLDVGAGIGKGAPRRNHKAFPGGLTIPRKIRSLSDENDYVSLNMPPIERRSLMEMGMRRKTTRLDVVVVVVFLIILLGALAYFVVQ